MAITRPTLVTIKNRVMADIEANIDQSTPLLRKALLRVIGYVFAGLSHMIYGYIDSLTIDLFPDTCRGTYLDRWASVWGITRKAATYASGPVILTGTDGTVIDAETKITGPNEIEYLTLASGTIAGGTVTVNAEAQTAGADGNLSAGTTMSLVNPISGVDSMVTAGTAGITGGEAEESDDDLRTRMLYRIQNPPQGGAASDYKLWALEVSGITRVWVTESYQGIGTVGVAVVTDNASTGIIPPQTKIDEVAAYIETVRPLGPTIYVYAPALKTTNFDIYISPSTDAVKTAVKNELAALFKNKGGPGSKIYISEINAAISAAAGEEHHTLFAPTDDIDVAATDIQTVGTITWRS